jgi:hypothetical protein
MDRHAEAMADVRHAILATPGETDPALRRRIAAGEPAEPYLEKVRRHAYRVAEGDIEAMREAGYSEDEIFELTLAAALGAADTRLAAGLAALER